VARLYRFTELLLNIKHYRCFDCRGTLSKLELRMTEEIKKTSLDILKAIKGAKNVLLHCHPYADPDSIGSVLAMTMVLKNMGISATPISGDSNYPSNLTSLPQHDLIVPKNFTQINVSDFDLFIIMDSSSPNQITKLTEVVFPKSLKTIVIDHHVSNQKYGDINLVVNDSSSTCEVLFNLFKEWKVEIDKDIAICLFLGIFSDTGGFKYQATTADTLLAASELARINDGFPDVIFEMENSRNAQEIEFTGLALSSLRKYFSGRVVMATVPFSDIEKLGISKEHTQVGIANILLSVVGWDIAISLVETEPNVVTVSLRTRDSEKYDVSLIAMAVGKGGGHKAAAGTSINESFEKSIEMLVDTIATTFPELGSAE